MNMQPQVITGFKFIDDKLGGLGPDKLCCIGGDADPIAAEQICLSLLKGITENQPDKFVILVNCDKFALLNCNVFAFYGENKSFGEMVIELSNRLNLKQIKGIDGTFNDTSLEELRREITRNLSGKSVSAIVMADGFKNSTKLKLIAKELQIPAIVYDCGYSDEDYEELATRHPAADILIRCKPTADDKVLELFCHKGNSTKLHKFRTGADGLQMSLDLPQDKNKLWFYQD